MVSLVVNLLFSWTLLPFVVPPFRVYSLRELVEVLLWQGMGAIGWPIALIGGLARLILHGRLSNLPALLVVLVYPAMLLLLVLAFSPKRPRRWASVLLHIFLTGSFAAVWHGVLSGYDFMKG